MKRKIIIIITLVISLIVIILSSIIYFNDSMRFKLSYEYINYIEYNNGKKIEVSIPTDNNVKYLNEKELLEFLNNGTGILYFGYNTCPWCRNAIPILIDVAKNNKLPIYYADNNKLDISSIKDELLKILGDYLNEDENGNKGFSVPDVYFIKEGNIIGHHIGTVESYHSPYKKMTNKQKKELSSIYQNLIEEMK